MTEPDRQQAAIDKVFMRQALDFAARGLGTTGTNPCVGAIVTQDTADGPVVVARGHTQPGGRPHGEANAFARAVSPVAGGTLYVTLEPCAHRSIRGATPCVELTLLSGVRRVVSAMEDPNPHISGLSHALLRTAGIAVTTGVLEDQARHAHRGYLSRITRGRPMVTFKVARTADGYAGGPGGERIAVSCPAASGWVHLQRAHHDGIMLGIGSVLTDDPLLTVRLPGMAQRSPIRIVLDSHLRLPLASQLVKTAGEVPVWVIATEAAPVERETALVAAGVEVMRVSADAHGHLDLGEALQLLGTRGLTRVFSEGGPTVAEKLAIVGLLDEVIVSTSPNALGRPGIVAVRPPLAALLADGDVYARVETGFIGLDRFEHFVRTG
ncbi:MAG TPA: bifunctional diaminohydroxyphosphoribosylaminopyrimidine deaminase/5-amino-6-(5-phosphoribosylamino)uracil reductase RibD [Bosea sp. (in: a-proteobacteria)]|jgi:diaminohydroxyphosphoribosylaminopyrimidine deaminase/5-amino-6-(5-phosphoribosylamino)uracil reductase|uniref:bifunctional diaminohydroxyphosphoribosylaminopyrimidine deaminase/5-amino-6-(5-phosphoribosylamino)uracil reductase RibD n=1 Tax=Bosea sp. (in: a-proteobacteria) TaxID=1871050 RepID=UPI002E0E637C|nr:bifunctional diaminohydroxyphosphoribosylaminopyrimidine deaminase/5-amino-6-(5-phosphoribosylamino)uracil reductase RibD [Bosea sp. (in: a-proteobacteria)]